MTKYQTKFFFVGISIALAFACIGVLLTNYETALGSTIAFAVPHVATSTLMSVGPGNATTVLPVASNCTGRAISTVAQPIMISFSSSLVPNGSQGHLQAASTTVFYNNGDYGCGAISVFGFTASTSITVTNFVQ